MSTTPEEQAQIDATFAAINEAVNPNRSHSNPGNKQTVDLGEFQQALAAPSPVSVKDGLTRADDVAPAVIERDPGEKERREVAAAKAEAYDKMVLDKHLRSTAEDLWWAADEDPRQNAPALNTVAAIYREAGPAAAQNLVTHAILARENLTVEDLDEMDEDDLADLRRDVQTMYAQALEHGQVMAEYEVNELTAKQAADNSAAMGDALISVAKQYGWDPEVLADAVNEAVPVDLQLALQAGDPARLADLLGKFAVTAEASEAAIQRAEFGNALLAEDRRTNISSGLTFNGVRARPDEWVQPEIQTADLVKAAGIRDKFDMNAQDIRKMLSKPQGVQQHLPGGKSVSALTSLAVKLARDAEIEQHRKSGRM